MHRVESILQNVVDVSAELQAAVVEAEYALGNMTELLSNADVDFKS